MLVEVVKKLWGPAPVKPVNKRQSEAEEAADLGIADVSPTREELKLARDGWRIFVSDFSYNGNVIRGRYFTVADRLLREKGFPAFRRWHEAALMWPETSRFLGQKFITTSAILLKDRSIDAVVMYGDLIAGIASGASPKEEMFLSPSLEAASDAAFLIADRSQRLFKAFARTSSAIKLGDINAESQWHGIEYFKELGDNLAFGSLPDCLEALPPGDLEAILASTEQSFKAGLDLEMYLETCLKVHGLLKPYGTAPFTEWLNKGLQLQENPNELKGYFLISTKQGQAALRKHMPGVALDEVVSVLGLYSRAIGGSGFVLRSLGSNSTALQASRTDGINIWLPPRLHGYGTREDNFQAYKVFVTLQAAKAEFGTFSLKREDVQELIENIEALYGTKASGNTPLKLFAAAFPVPELATALFELIEGQRVVNRVREDYKGIRDSLDKVVKREMELRPLPQGSGAAGTDVNLLMEYLMRRLAFGALPIIVPKSVKPTLEGLYKLAVKATGRSATVADSLHSAAACYGLINVKLSSGFALNDRIRIEELPLLLFQGGFEKAAETAVGDSQGGAQNKTASSYRKANGIMPLKGRFVYPQWDKTSCDYLPEWCKVEEFDLPPVENAPPVTTLRQQLQLAQLFEMVYGGAAVKERRRPEGEFDIDAAVEFMVDLRRGTASAEPKVYTNRRKQPGGIAAAFLIDTSPSASDRLADGRRVIDAERESLEVLIAGMEQAGHAFGVFGFSGGIRTDVRVYVVKCFDEKFDRRRLYSLEPRPIGCKPHESSTATVQNSPIIAGTYTGPAVRHLTMLLAERKEPAKLLVVLTDSRPTAVNYDDDYARADVKKAFSEAKAKGVHPLAISFSSLAKETLVESYGPRFIEVLRAEELVRKLPRAYIALMR